jgi:Ca-activated chloride channel family protein
LWANRDQRALQALQHGDAAQARKLASTPGVRGAADYRVGNYADAAKAFAQGDDARARYNLGNALAKQGEYEKAIAAYKQALQRDPKMADARANLDAVEDWLKKHQQHSPQSGRQNSNGQPSSSSGGGSSSRNTGKDSGKSGARQGAASSAPQASSATGANNAAGKQGAQQQGNAGTAQQDHDTSAAEAAKQQKQTQQARQALAREMQQARKTARSEKQGNTNAFALGEDAPKQDGQFDAQQRAILQAVPDDPGALLRRKFRLEWEQRNGRQPEEPQQ